MIRQTDTTADSCGIRPLRSAVCVLKAVVVSYIFLIISFAVLAAVYTYTSMPQGYLKTSVDVLALTALVLAGVLSSKNIRVFGWLHGAGAGLLSSLIRIFLGIMVFGSYVPTESPWKLVVTGIICSMLGGILGVNLSPKKTAKKRKKR